ncbi:MAG: FAD-binding oxidoreductase [Flavobacteriales bacterium]|nr:FAD-binding oxidoreductase [Flavobacteriales bacterium]
MIAILGQGIAGTTIALRLLERGRPFVILDNSHKTSSSMVAAGLWNPIVFRRINKSWMADEFIRELESFYPKIESLIGANFYRPRPVWRLHGSKQEFDKWHEKKYLPGFKHYLNNPPLKMQEFLGYASDYGEGEVRHTGYLDLPSFLLHSREFFSNKGLLVESEMGLQPSLDELTFVSNSQHKIAQVIDCRGSQSAKSDWWSYLPFGLTKGEVLTIRCPQLFLDKTFNAGFFVLPLGNHVFRVGATFNWKDKSIEPTERGRHELSEKFEKYFDFDYEVLEHKAGIRPTVQDRRPLIGHHPKLKHLSLFNGLGTKGVMLAPYLSNHFLDFLIEGAPLIEEANLGRFNHLFGQINPQINHPN